MHDHGGGSDGSAPTHPSPLPSPKRTWPEDYPFWLSSLSPEFPSLPRQHLPSDQEAPSAPGTPLRPIIPVICPPTPIPHLQSPLPPLAQRRPARHPPAADWRESQYKVKDAEQFRDKPKRTSSSTSLTTTSATNSLSSSP